MGYGFAAQTLIKQSSPVGGLQKVCCGLTMSFTTEPSEFIQILYVLVEMAIIGFLFLQ